MYQLISPQTIYQYFGDDDKEMLLEMIQIILDTNLHDLKSLDKAFSDEDYPVIKKSCHKSKPSLSYIGAIQTRKLVEQIEGDIPSAQNLYQDLKAQIKVIENELRQFLNSVE
ncbi:Hpt domain-containing protein [Mongoliitalea daihaiensis]|uniref:Hpt domain-containing protein n=1 Tax=Mongoliitalea daihaiensis TaxID=2782006 RepID=UPI001F3C1415|nr:Hpt domain-containing protein [Mongoliitalea daihaiensis]UJP64199.1 Hpt domain-containing protein [Mongoliitalea daihaiensis]